MRTDVSSASTRSSTSRRGVAFVGIAALATLGLGACSSDDDGDSSSVTTVAPVQSAAPVDTAAPVGSAAPVDSAAPVVTGDALPPAGEGGELTISDFTFSDLTTAAGAEISISNQDGFSHTVTDKDGAFDVAVDGGATQTLTIDEPGTYSIICKIHPQMAGTITVT